MGAAARSIANRRYLAKSGAATGGSFPCGGRCSCAREALVAKYGADPHSELDVHVWRNLIIEEIGVAPSGWDVIFWYVAATDGASASEGSGWRCACLLHTSGPPGRFVPVWIEEGPPPRFQGARISGPRYRKYRAGLRLSARGDFRGAGGPANQTARPRKKLPTPNAASQTTWKRPDRRSGAWPARSGRTSPPGLNLGARLARW